MYKTLHILGVAMSWTVVRWAIPLSNLWAVFSWVALCWILEQNYGKNVKICALAALSLQNNSSFMTCCIDLDQALANARVPNAGQESGQFV